MLLSRLKEYQSQAMKNIKSKTIVSLPKEILSDILSCLPIRCLGKCKCVCKLLHSSISDPELVRSHLDRAIPDTNNSRIFTICPFNSLNFESTYAYEEGDYDRNEAFIDLDPPSDQPADVNPDSNGAVEFVGSCNGLICLYYTPNSFVLWNPTIKESRKIPDPALSYDDRVLIFYGFGHVPSADDYKLVTCFYENDTKTAVMVEVFGLKANSWMRIEHNLDNVTVDSGNEMVVGIFLNGTLHWELTHDIGPNKYKKYIFLDLAGEEFKFGEFLEPKTDNVSLEFHHLGVIEGCLSLISEGNRDVIGIWIMKEYGVRESWTRLAVLSLSDFSSGCYVHPVCFAKNGELIVDIDGERLLRYDMEENVSRELKNGEAPRLFYALYVESLVSPNVF